MRSLPTRLVLVVLSLVTASSLYAQTSTTSVTVPRFVRLTGTFTPSDRQPPAPVETVTLAIYADETGGAPLWQETQYVALDGAGRYAVLLGATQPEGLPVDLFASGEARWLGRRFERAGEPEQARVLLASVPYALKAANADTLGGLPPSAYQLVDPAGGGSANASTSLADTAASGASPTQTVAAPSPQALTSGTAGCVAEFTNSTDLGCSPMVDTGGAIGLGTATPFDRFHVRFTNTNGAFTGLAVQNLGNTATSYSGMLFYDQNGALGQFQGFNNVTHEYRINNIASSGSINFMLGGSSKFQVRADGDIDIPNRIRLGGSLFLHQPGIENTFLGKYTGGVLTTGSSNTAVGIYALGGITSGSSNTAIGSNALVNNTTGSYNTASGTWAMLNNIGGNNNTAVGAYALRSGSASTAWNNTAVGVEVLRKNSSGQSNTGTGAFAFDENTTGSGNTADGAFALEYNSTGNNNLASGMMALFHNTTGSDNAAVGKYAGYNATTGSNNIYIGSNTLGVAGEANTIYVGVQGTQQRTLIAGIRGVTTAINDAVPVMIDSSGQLGTISSSRRFKEDILDMGDASRALFALRPVTFRYSQPYADGSKPMHYGLVAEEVAAVFPELAVRNADGSVDTVHYETLSVLLLNELQKQTREMQQRDEQQQRRIETLERRLETLAANSQP